MIFLLILQTLPFWLLTYHLWANFSKIFLDWLRLFLAKITKNIPNTLAIIVPIIHFRVQKPHSTLKLFIGGTLPHKPTECNK